MKKMGWFSRLSNLQPSAAIIQCAAGCVGVAALLAMSAVAAAQNPTADNPLAGPGTPMSIPDGYSVHESVDLGGHIANTAGSGAMYDTLVNLQSGPRLLGETFELRALPGKKGGLVDNLKLFSNGFGGDPNQFTRMDFEKGRLYDFSGIFRRDRQYFDYDLLGNPNIPGGKTLPIGSSAAPTSRFAWPQINQSPEMFNTVRRMTDTNLTLLPLSKVTFRAGYAQNIFQGPSLTPSGYQGALSSSLILQEYQRNSTDDFIGAVDWKPVMGTKLTFEEQVNHYKADSYFTLSPQSYIFQEADGTRIVPFVSFDSMLPYGYSTTTGAFAASNVCNTGSMVNSTTVLNAPQAGGLPVIDPACAVVSSYRRYQPTRILTPTEIFRLQSTSLKNVSMNGNVRYTSANMNMPYYSEYFNGLTHVTTTTAGALRTIAYQGNANAKRKVMAVDYGVAWQVVKKFSLSDQISFSNVQQPGIASLTGVTALATTAAPNQTVTYSGPLATGTAPGFEGAPAVGSAAAINAGYFGQKFVTNNLTGTWDATDRATISLTYRYQMHSIAEGGSTHSGDVDDCPAIGGTAQLVAMCGTTTIHESTGILTAAYRPTSNWDINGSVEIGSYDNSFTAVSPRQVQHYRVHTMFRPKTWATISGAYNDLERHNNTFNTQGDIATGTIYYGPVNYVNHNRTVSVTADLAPNEHYGFNLDYSFNSVYTASNVCFPNGAATWAPGAATPPGTSVPTSGVYSNGVCQGVFSRGSTTAMTNWYGRVFADAPTQSAAASLVLSPVEKVHANVGYRISAVSGSQFFQDARAVNGSLNSTYQSPFLSLAYALHKNFIWKGEYNYFGYGEGGVSGAQYCNTATPTTTTPNVPVVACSTLAGLTAQAGPAWGFTAPRNFHANNVTLGVHYEF